MPRCSKHSFIFEWMNVWSQIAKFNAHQYYHLYGIHWAQVEEIVFAVVAMMCICQSVVMHFVSFWPTRVYRELKLRTPFYQKTAVYGHFGREEFPWEVSKPLVVDWYGPQDLEGPRNTHHSREETHLGIEQCICMRTCMCFILFLACNRPSMHDLHKKKRVIVICFFQVMIISAYR